MARKRKYFYVCVALCQTKDVGRFKVQVASSSTRMENLKTQGHPIDSILYEIGLVIIYFNFVSQVVF